MINNSKIIFLITSNYPFGIYETFLEDELKYLENKFDKVVIITTYSGTNNSKRHTGKSTEVIRIVKKNLLNRLKYYFLALSNRIFYYELIDVFKSRRKIFEKAKTVIISFSNAYGIQNELKQNIDIYSQYQNYVFYSYWFDDSAIAICLLNLKYKEVCKISRAHGWDLYFERSKNNFLPFRKFLLSELTKIYTISDDGRDYLRKLSKNKGCKIQTSRLGTSFIVNQKKDNHKKTFNSVVICSCSYIVPVKRIELIYSSLQFISEIKIEWFHIGKGELNRGYQEEIINRIELNDKENLQIHFLGDLPNAAVLDFFNETKVDLFINLSSSEGIPVSIMEAMSFGIPVIATNVGVTSEIVNDINGYLLDANPSSKEVANAIEGFYNLKGEVKASKRKAAYETWNEEYNAENNYAEFVEDILSL